MIKTLLIGPLPPPISGLSVVNQFIVNKFENNPYVKISFLNTGIDRFSEDIGEFTLRKVILFTTNYLKIFKIINYNIIYMTPGQTFFGVFKYAPFIFFASIFHKQLIIHVHGDYIWQEYQKLHGVKKRIYSLILKKFSKGIVLSEKLKRNLTPFITDIYVLKNFFDIQIPNNYLPPPKKNCLQILFMSNIMAEKGIFDLLEALLTLEKKQIDFEAHIAGALDENNKSKFFEFLSHINKNTTYHGMVTGEAKNKLLYDSNVFVFPTYYQMEGQPISILEAMATGNIILTTNHAGIPDIFEEEKNGFYIKKQNPLDIANKLILLSQNLDQYKNIAINNYHEARSKYTVDIFIKNIHQILV